MATTKKPSGLTITRDGGLKFVMSWKITDDNYSAGQQLRWRVWKNATKHTAWTTLKLSTSATSKTVIVPAADYYPNDGMPKIYSFEFEVRGKRETETETVHDETITTTYEWSAWNGKNWIIKVPKRPNLTAELTDDNVTVFSWEGNNETDDERPFSKFQYQTALKKDSKETDGSKITGWSALASANNDGSSTQEEDTTALLNGSHTRWFRVRAIGPAGVSEWRYAKHVYAKPKKATIQNVSAKRSNGNTNVVVKWKAPSSAAYPIDETVVEYCIDTPRSGMNIPANPTWEEGASSQDTADTDSANFVLSQQVVADQCLFVRIVTKHDTDVNAGNYTPSNFAVADIGPLTPPDDESFEVTLGTDHVATIKVKNDSAVPDARVAIICRDEKKKDIIVAVSATGSTLQTLTANCPVATNRAKFGAFAFQGEYEDKEINDPITGQASRVYHAYSIDENMISSKIWESEATYVPDAPGSTKVKKSGSEALISWKRTWKNATKTELSWSTNKNAWKSTEEPQRYIIDDKSVTDWRIAGIEAGNVWYFRIRFIDDSGDDTVYGPYCDTLELDLTSKPETPILKLSRAIVKPGGKLRASWIYECEDGFKQAEAELCRVFDPGEETERYGKVFARTDTKKKIDFSVGKWTPGTTYYIALRVTSARGKVSEWSEPVPLFVGNPITCAIVQNSLQTSVITDSDGNERIVKALKGLPLTVTVLGAGEGGTTTLIIERLTDYHMERPDGSFKDGFAGETIAIERQTGEGQMKIKRDELIGIFDDGASYRMIATVEDGNGQSDSDEVNFEVHWNHQARKPSAEVEIENGAAVITVNAPAYAVAGDACDIYRLSTDPPQLIVQGGEWDSSYVDPYPAIGENAGYRVVDVTKYGDYITANNQPAWRDYYIGIEDYDIIIDFNGNTIHLPYNIKLSNRWAKDFKLTKYLGGAQQGDWNPGAIRTATYSVVLYADDTKEIMLMRELADYDGICHIRTPEGSSFAADIQVSESKDYGKWDQVSFTLQVTRVDPERLDGITYEEWINSIAEVTGVTGATGATGGTS